MLYTNHIHTTQTTVTTEQCHDYTMTYEHQDTDNSRGLQTYHYLEFTSQQAALCHPQVELS